MRSYYHGSLRLTRSRFVVLRKGIVEGIVPTRVHVGCFITWQMVLMKDGFIEDILGGAEIC